MIEKESIGHYKIVDLLGSGAMGTVHSAIDTLIDREVAIKSLRPELTRDDDFVSRFRAEAKSLARLNHPNIATLFAPIIDGAQLHLVMELVRGKSLEDILRGRGRPLAPRESLAIIAQAADGLSYAHEMGVVHRDIKPANLLVSDDGRVKIMDFGIARVQGSVRLTRTGTAVGTPLYMSPEQCRGGEGDERSDIYSLAIVLYELLSGAPPFQGATEYELIQAQISQAPAPLVPRIPGVTPGLESAVMTALAKKPEQRFASMRAFSDALGATALRPDATGIIRNADSLLKVDDEATKGLKSAGTLDVAVSRALGLSRAWSAMGVLGRGAIVVAITALVGGGAFLIVNRGADAPLAAAPPAPPAPSLDDLRLAIKGLRGAEIHAADFELVSNGLKAELLAPAEALAGKGEAEAQFVLAMLLSETPGHIDRQKAFALFEQSAQRDYPDAEVNLAAYYQMGFAPGGKDLDKAAYWYDRAARQGNGKALFWLGCYHQFGWGGKTVDPQKALDFYTRAVAAHYPRATDALQSLVGGAGAPSPCR